MTNEIKEILDTLKYCVEKNEYLEVPNMKEWKPLLDYITNLQEEKENAVECLKYYEEIHFIKPAVDNMKLTIELYNAYLKEINNLQQRIDNAVEYINKYEYQKYCPSPYEKDKYIMREEKEGQDLLDILRGDD